MRELIQVLVPQPYIYPVLLGGVTQVFIMRWSLPYRTLHRQEALHSLQDASIRLSYVNMRIVEQGLSKSMSLKGSQA